MILQGERVTLRPQEPADVPPLTRSSPSRRSGAGGGPTRGRRPGRVHDLRRRGDRRLARLVRGGDGRLPPWRAGHLPRDRFQGRGLGREMLQLGAEWLIEAKGHHRLIIDPAAGNARAIATYTAVGFKPVGVMRRYERGPDGDVARRAADGHARRGARQPQLSRVPWPSAQAMRSPSWARAIRPGRRSRSRGGAAPSHASHVASSPRDPFAERGRGPRARRTSGRGVEDHQRRVRGCLGGEVVEVARSPGLPARSAAGRCGRPPAPGGACRAGTPRPARSAARASGSSPRRRRRSARGRARRARRPRAARRAAARRRRRAAQHRRAVADAAGRRSRSLAVGLAGTGPRSCPTSSSASGCGSAASTGSIGAARRLVGLRAARQHHRLDLAAALARRSRNSAQPLGRAGRSAGTTRAAGSAGACPSAARRASRAAPGPRHSRGARRTAASGSAVDLGEVAIARGEPFGHARHHARPMRVRSIATFRRSGCCSRCATSRTRSR